MSCGIFIRSYRGDREWLKYCLRSIKKHARGFDDLVVVLPYACAPHFENFDFYGARVEWCHPVAKDDYVGQQFSKICADTYLQTDQILFIDSDTVATAPFSPDSFGGDKPLQIIRPWDQVGDAICWRDCTEAAMGFAPRFEHMAVMPLVYHRENLGGLRAHLEIVQNKPVADFFYGVTDRRVSEFNLLGSYAQQYMPHRYDWRLADPAVDGYPRTFKQFWSHGGIEAFIPELERLTK